ncbi:hypothetical protein OOK13_07000 [Streptomyces sp. NBC_00378]|uniref:hypothetical protein n=1 Tax=unclassified Streptomyces TaxID=2593676 RepID=UPI00225A51D9|nr:MULTISPECIES: hypothetical protein [unclassified Streptomyces]MCX5108275.1 hypothetical protein [Streptomyces sp. NBC_00378]
MPCRRAAAPAPFPDRASHGSREPAGPPPVRLLFDAISTAFIAGVIISAAVLLVALFAISNKKQQAVHDEAAGAPA